jgi:hypothetical protein
MASLPVQEHSRTGPREIVLLSATSVVSLSLSLSLSETLSLSLSLLLFGFISLIEIENNY